MYCLSGTAYTGAILPMQIVMPTLFLIGISNLLGIQILVPLNREKDVFKSVSLGAVVNLVINIICIPKFGASGAAFGTLIAELFVTGYQFYVLRTFLKDLINKVKLYKNILATLLASFVVLILKNIIISSFFVILVESSLIFGLIYILICFALGDDFTIYLVNYIKNKVT